MWYDPCHTWVPPNKVLQQIFSDDLDLSKFLLNTSVKSLQIHEIKANWMSWYIKLMGFRTQSSGTLQAPFGRHVSQVQRVIISFMLNFFLLQEQFDMPTNTTTFPNSCFNPQPWLGVIGVWRRSPNFYLVEICGMKIPSSPCKTNSFRPKVWEWKTAW